MTNYLWLLENKDHNFIDQIYEVVISARSAKKARSIASENAKDEGAALWLDLKKSTCRRIGIAFSPKERVVITDMPGF